MMPYTDAHWQRFFAAVGQPQLALDARFASQASRTAHIAELLETAGEHVALHGTQYWLDTCQRLEIPAAPVARMDDLPADPHLQATEFFVPLEDPAMGTVHLPRSSVRMDGRQAPMGMPPRLGEHTAALLAQAGWSAERIAGLQITQQET